MQWICAKKTWYITSMHKLSGDEHLLNALLSSSILGLQTEMFPLSLHFQLQFLVVTSSTRISMLIIFLKMF